MKFAIDVGNDNRINGFLRAYQLENQFLESKELSYKLLIKKINNTSFDGFERIIEGKRKKALSYLTDAL